MKLSHYLPSALALVAFAGLAQAQVTLFDNGSLVTAPGGGTGAIAGQNLSVIDANSGIFGAGVNSNAGLLIADNFSVPCGLQWSVSSVKVYAYQTGAAVPTLTGGFLQIWDGQPGTAGATLVAGDLTTNALTAAAFASPAVYRVQAGVTNGATRRIQEATLSLGAPVTLGSPTATKTYWIVYGLTGSLASGPFTPPLAPRASDNAIQSGDLGVTWAGLDQGATAALATDVAFKVVGTQSGTSCPAPAAPTITLAGGNFGTGTATIAAGQVRFFKITLATAIGATSRLDIDTEGSVLTAPSFGPGLLNDTILALYREDGTLISSDDDDGAGFLSQLSFGTPLQYSTTTASNFDGRDGATLPAGNYYIGVCGIGNPTNINAGFDLTTNSDATGSVTVRARRVDGITAISAATLPGVQTFPALTAGSTTNATVNVAAGVTKWVKFTVPTAIDATAALDIFSEGTTGMTPANDISFGLYNSTGGLVATDFVNGSNSLALISFGGGFRNRIGTSWNFYGQNGAALAAGDYYLAIVGGDTSNFGPSSFNVLNGVAPNSGPVNLSIRYKTDVTADVGTIPTVSAANDFGTLVDGTTATKTVTVTPESVSFFKFTIDANAPLNGLLVIDTEGSSLTPTNDTAIRLFDASGNSAAALGGLDADAGSGLLSQLTFGDGAAILTNAVLGQQANSRDGVFPPAGDYYLAVRTGNGGGSGVNNWNMNANGLNSGSLSVNIRYIADSFTATTEAPTPVQTLPAIGGTQTVTANVNAEDIVWVKISLPAGVSPSDWLDIDNDGSPAALDTVLGIYDAGGNLIAVNDDGGAGLLSQLSFGSGDNTGRPTFPGALDRLGQNGTLNPGDYYVASTVFSGTTVGFATGNFDVRTTHATAVPNFTINFRSSFTPAGPACLADVNIDGVVDGSDFVAFINSFAIGDVGIDAIADVNLDGVIDGSDFVAFINAFALGC